MEKSQKERNLSQVGAPSALKILWVIGICIFAALLSGCAGPTPKYNLAPKPSTKSTRFHKATLRPYVIKGVTYHPFIPEKGHTQNGIASWYGYESPNRVTANGEPFDTDIITAAHKTFPLPSLVEVTNLDNGKKLIVRVNDRGPFAEGRIIDLSRASAKALGVYASGTARVRLKWLGPVGDENKYSPQSIESEAAVKPQAHYIVQIGAYGLIDNAKKAQDRLDNAKIIKREALYIVYVGPFATANLAEKARQEALGLGFTAALIKAQ